MCSLLKIISFCRCFEQRSTEALESTGRCGRKSLAQGHNGISAETQPRHSPPAESQRSEWSWTDSFIHTAAVNTSLSAVWVQLNPSELPLNTLPFWSASLIINLKGSGVLMVALLTSGRKEEEEERLSGAVLRPPSPPSLKWLLFVCCSLRTSSELLKDWKWLRLLHYVTAVAGYRERETNKHEKCDKVT